MKHPSTYPLTSIGLQLKTVIPTTLKLQLVWTDRFPVWCFSKWSTSLPLLSYVLTSGMNPGCDANPLGIDV